MSKIDILHLDWPNSERDLNISIPVLVYLKKKYNYSVKSKNIFNGLFYLRLYKPKALLLSNSIGADINFIVSKYAFEAGVYVFTLTSEGNFKENHMNTFLWGWNKEKKNYHHLQNIWSERALKLAIDDAPDFKRIGFVGGGTGFDKYKLLPKLNKADFYDTYPSLKKFKSIIGITSFGYYEHLHTPEYVVEHKIEERYGIKQLKMYYDDYQTLKNTYRDIILKNPETLFILRTHPLSKNLEKTEFKDCSNLPNVFLSIPGNKKLSSFQNELSVVDCISLAELWIAYESTTIMEAWLLNKPTTVFNPTTFDFTREDSYKGATKISNSDSLLKNIREITKGQKNIEFEELKSIREQIIKDTIGFSDGKNHQRVGDKIDEFLKKNKNQVINTNKIPLKLTWEYYKSFKKQASKLYQLYNPNVHSVHKQNDKIRFKEIYKKYNNVINP
jgi:hypothetical protein